MLRVSFIRSDMDFVCGPGKCVSTLSMRFSVFFSFVSLWAANNEATVVKDLRRK